MKRQLRFSVFETNSSMSHSLQLMTKADYEELLAKEESDEWAWSLCDEKLVRVDSKEYDEDCTNSYFDEEADYEIEEFTTPSGDVVVGISRAKEEY